MLKQRVITATFMAIGFIALLFAPTLIQALIFSVLVIIALWEFLGLCRVVGWTRILLCGASLLGFGVGVVNFSLFSAGFLNTVLGAASALWAVIFLWVLSYPASAALWGAKASKVVQGLCLLVGAWLAFMVLAHDSSAHLHLLYVVVLVAAADIGAYFSGKTFGKHKLAPSVSPGKTWEGFAGGSVAVLLCALAVTEWVGDIVFLNTFGFVCLAIACGFISVVGDLYESMIKREVGAKDSSQLLPGHGGLLDRVDGLIAAATLYVFVFINSGAA